MKNILLNLLKGSALLMLLTFGACKIEPISDPNNPNIDDIINNASLSELQNLIDGSESGMRNSMNFYLEGVGVIGREIYRYSGSDPRYTSDLLGKGEATLDNNTFYTTNPFAARYRVIKNNNILIAALGNTSAPLTTEEKKGTIGYAKTINAYQMLLVLNQQYNNGIREDVGDPDALGPFLDYTNSLRAITDLLDSGNTDLAGASFPFRSSLVTDVASIVRLNRALYARVAVYRQDWDTALTALDASFFDLNGDLNAGVFHVYSNAGGDLTNPMYYPDDASGETIVVQPDFVTDAEAGDTRVATKTRLRTTGEEQVDGLSSAYDLRTYTSQTAPIPVIRNEELILIYAEAKAQNDVPADAIVAINIIRAAAGLGIYTGSTDKQALLDEILHQRRYSLFAEGHRWVDMRRYNKLGDLPIDRPGDDVWDQFPRPADEGL